jgi:hypothetical protein
MISFGVVHAAYIAIATSAKNAAELGVTPNSLTGLAVIRFIFPARERLFLQRSCEICMKRLNK